jgi:hypothetical protein
MDLLLRRIMRTAARRGMRGEHWAWFVIAAAAFALRRARRREDPLVYSQTVVPGDRLLLSVRSSEGEPLDSPASG